ncbi:MAG TPA: hypothetical protein VID03_06225 [Acidimicrobiia bacterium]
MNPVLAREVKERFRTRRASFWVFAWTLLVGLFVYLLYLMARGSYTGVGRLVATGLMGRFMFEGITLVLMTAVIMVVPGLAALAIVSERERQTFPLLQVTQLKPMQLIGGKLWSSLAFLLLLLLAITPVMALPLLYGGVGVDEVLIALGMILLTAVTLGSVSIYVSARAKSSRAAVAGSYVIAFLIGFFTFALMIGEMLVFSPNDNVGDPFGFQGRELYTIWPNPYFGMVDAVVAPLNEIQSGVEAGPYAVFTQVLLRRQGVGFNPVPFEGVGRGGVIGVGDDGAIAVDLPKDDPAAAVAQVAPALRRGPIWVRTIVIFLTITLISLIRAAAWVRAPASKPFLTRRSRNATA